MKKAVTKSSNWLIAGLSEEEIQAKKKLAIIAFEKQIPEKVIFKPYGDMPECCICPRCGFDMMGVYDFTDYNTKDPSFCPVCGQALDWGDK